jgi:hypothetical protein
LPNFMYMVVSTLDKIIDWLIIYCFTSRSRILSLIWRRHYCRWRLQNLGLCSALKAFKQGGSLSCHTYCDTGPRFFRSHPKDSPNQSPLTTRLGVRGIYSNPIFTGTLDKREKRIKRKPYFERENLYFSPKICTFYVILSFLPYL